MAVVAEQDFEQWPPTAPFALEAGATESQAPALRGRRSAKCAKGTEQRVSYQAPLALDRTYFFRHLTAPSTLPSENLALSQIFSTGSAKTLAQLFLGANGSFILWNNFAGATLANSPILGIDVFWIEWKVRIASVGNSTVGVRLRNLYGLLLWESGDFATNLGNQPVTFTSAGHITKEPNADVLVDAFKIVDETGAADNTWIGPEPLGISSGNSQPQIEPTVVSIAEGGNGRGYDLTDQVEGLGYSNVNPGGDEVATFTVHRPWYDDSPDLARGNLLRICNGIDVLWQGRIEEADRSADSSETIAVTAYGLGVRAKDGNFREIFIDRDLSKWGEPSAQRRINYINASFSFQGDASIGQHDSGEGPGIVHHFQRIASPKFATVESVYYGSGIDIGLLRYDAIAVDGLGAGSAEWFIRATLASDDVATDNDVSVDYDGVSASNQSLLATASGREYAFFTFCFAGTFTGDGDWTWLWRYPCVLGRHFLSPQGTWPNIGFTVDQMVRYIIEQVPGLTARQIDGQSFVVEQAVYTSPGGPHEDAIRDLNRYENCDWGTWGPTSPLDNSTDGYFDFTDQDLTTQHWFVLRQSCDAEDLHSETATLYGKVDVVYTDEAGIERVVRVEVDVPDLDSAGLSRTYTLSIGQATETIARAEGEAFLNVWGQFAPARGTFTVSQPVRHYQRGMLSPLYMRADGANVRIPDILPASTLFALDATPDRRTTFPIKRVSVDCSGAEPQATVEVDQADDALSVLQARSDLKTSLIPA